MDTPKSVKFRPKILSRSNSFTALTRHDSGFTNCMNRTASDSTTVSNIASDAETFEDLFRFATRAKDFIADTADTTDASELDQLQQPRPSSVKLPSRTPSLTGMGGFKLGNEQPSLRSQIESLNINVDPNKKGQTPTLDSHSALPESLLLLASIHHGQCFPDADETSFVTAQGWGNEQTSFARMSRSGTHSGSVTPSLDSPTPTPRHNCSSESLSGLFIPTGSRGTNNVQSRRDSDPLINRTVQRSGSGASVRAKNILKLKADSPKGLTALFQDTCLKYGDLLKSNDSSRSALNRIVTSVSNKA